MSAKLIKNRICNFDQTKNLKINSNPEVEIVFSKYAEPVRKKLLKLRKLIIEAAKEIKEIKEIEETLKWGEPSYLVKNGSTIRIDWKEKNPDHYAIYFKCTSKLVPAFIKAYGNKFEFEGTRAIVFKIDDKDKVPETELKQCITAALQYHKVKNLPDLGI